MQAAPSYHIPEHWAEGAGTVGVRTGEFAPSKATLRKLKSELKTTSALIVSAPSRLQAFGLKARLSRSCAFIYFKQAEEEMHSVTVFTSFLTLSDRFNKYRS